MTFPEFDQFFDDFVLECRKMRDTKGKEYANGEDRFKNFYDGAKELGVTPLQVGMIFTDKHIRSIKSFIRTGKIHSEERIRGRFMDVVTYMILMAGIAEETLASPLIECTEPLVRPCFYPDNPCNLFGTNHSICDYAGIITENTTLLRG